MPVSVSVVIPAFNATKFIGAALRSVLGQTVPPVETIVVDDGSADDTARIAAGFGAPVRVLKRPHSGGSATLNFGIGEAKGEMLAFLDADDLWCPNKLALQLNYLRENGDIDAVYGHVAEFLDGDDPIEIEAVAGAAEQKLPGAGKSTLLIRAPAFHRIGLFDTSFAVADFPEWYARAADLALRSFMLPDVVALRRVHSHNTSRARQQELHADYLRLVRQSIQRRKK